MPSYPRKSPTDIVNTFSSLTVREEVPNVWRNQDCYQTIFHNDQAQNLMISEIFFTKELLTCLLFHKALTQIYPHYPQTFPQSCGKVCSFINQNEAEAKKFIILGWMRNYKITVANYPLPILNRHLSQEIPKPMVL